ncbi:MAG TPA: hypothetical protein VF530_14790 [Planctomycetota bacterium]
MKKAIEKHGMEIGMKMAASAGLLLALGGLGSAQHTSDGRGGQELVRGSLENDLRPGLLNLRVMLRGEFDPQALIPVADDFDKLLVLSGGGVRAGAAIELLRLDTRGHGAMGGAVISGFFGQNGEYVVELPKELDLRGLGARGAQFSGRLVTEVVDLDEAVAEAYATWIKLGEIAAPQGTGPGGMHGLQRPSRGAGAGLRAPAPTKMVTRSVDLGEEAEAGSITFEKIGKIARPQAAGSAGSKHELKRPAKGKGSAAQADAPTRTVTRSVDLGVAAQPEAGITFEKIGKIARPQAAGSPGSKIDLRRVVRRGGHTR